MESFNILDLPEKNLISILKFVPDRWAASQTCKGFYALVAKIERFKYRVGENWTRELIMVRGAS